MESGNRAPVSSAESGGLPAAAGPLIGRDELLAAALTLLRDEGVHLVTLTGPAGGGKTRLAVALASALAAEFRHGVRFVDLSAVRAPAQVLPTVADALGIREAGGRVAQRPVTERLARALRERHLLVVLDNFEQVLAAAPDIGDLLARCPGVKALVTSRAALHLRWEHELAVPPLEVPDLRQLPDPDELTRVPAVALFVERARAVRRDFALDTAGAQAVAEVCVRLDGLPLAIGLAAARAKVLPPAALLARLERRLQLLVGGAPDRPTRHQTLRAALDWSHELLAAPEQALLRRLSVFAGGFTLVAAEAVCSGQYAAGSGGPADVGGTTAPGDGRGPPTVNCLLPTDVLGTLETLVDNSLVRPAPVHAGEPRYALLETIREYALDRLQAAGEVAAAHQRHAAYFLALAETAAASLRGPGQAAWLRRLEEEHDNLRAALVRALASAARTPTGPGGGLEAPSSVPDGSSALGGAPPPDEQVPGCSPAGEAGESSSLPPVEVGLRLAAALAPFWRTHSHLSEGIAWLERLLDAAPAAPAAVRAEGLLGAGALARERAVWDRARTWLEEALALSRGAGGSPDARLEGRTLHALGEVLLDTGDVAAARPLLEQGVEQLRAAGGPGNLGDALLAVAKLAEAGGNLRQARDVLEEALDAGRRDGDAAVVASALCDLGRLVLFQGERARARALLEEGLQAAETLGAAPLTIKLHRWLGSVAGIVGDHDLAGRHLRASLDLAREHDDPLGVAYTLASLGEVSLRSRAPDAVPLLEESLRLFTELNHPWGRGRALRGLEGAAAHGGDPAAALDLLGQELTLWRDLDDGLAIAGCLERVADLVLARSQAPAAARLLGAAAALRERIGAAERADSDVPAATRSALARRDAAEWRTAWAAGRELAPEEAIAEALALTSAPPPPAPPVPAAGGEPLPFDLTPREAEVLQLLAAGTSDAEIARRLVISIRTVHRHVANILGKTGAPNRTAAAALAHRSGLSSDPVLAEVLAGETPDA
jgi:predicted ATPase/DNA-binding CsgD family transcriptional regulator